MTIDVFRRMWTWLVARFRPGEQGTPLAVDAIMPPAPILKRTRRSGYKILEPLRRDIESTALDIIERLDKINLSNAATEMALKDSTEGMSYLVGCDFHLLTESLWSRMDGGGKYLNPENESREYAEAIWPFDIATISETERGLNLVRVWTAELASLRGRVKFVPQKSVWCAYMQIDDDNKWWADLSPIGLIGNKWQYLDPGIIRVVSDSMRGMTYSERQKPQPNEADKIVSIATSIALTERYSWHVAFGNETAKSLRLLLPTNPLGCLALFKSREKRVDETRRAALRHWVSTHYREHGNRDIAFVRDHLRGATLFDWRGFNCEILVSQFDLEKNEFFKNQAHEWRAQRKHNRVRLKLKKSLKEKQNAK